jgi:hypothetical protein
MRKLIYIAAALALHTVGHAQSQPTLSVQQEKIQKQSTSTNTHTAKQIDPATPLEPAVNYYTITAVPSTSLDPSLVPSLGKPAGQSTKGAEVKSSPK